MKLPAVDSAARQVKSQVQDAALAVKAAKRRIKALKKEARQAKSDLKQAKKALKKAARDEKKAEKRAAAQKADASTIDRPDAAKTKRVAKAAIKTPRVQKTTAPRKKKKKRARATGHAAPAAAAAAATEPGEASWNESEWTASEEPS